MKVALINPPWPHPRDPMCWGVRAGSRWPHFQRRPTAGRLPRYIPFPFFMAIAARMLADAGHAVLLLDGVAENASSAGMLARLAKFAPELIFIETSSPSLKNDLQIAAEIKRCLPASCIAAGGTHPPELAQALLNQPTAPFAYWLAGEYEIPLVRLVEALQNGQGLNRVPGLLTSSLSNAPFTPEVDRLPMPLYDQLPMQNYADPVCGLPAPTAQSWLSRGCPFGCTFCVWPQLIYGNRRYRPRRIELALDEVSYLIEHYHCESFYFDDDTANMGEARMQALAENIRRRGLNAFPWSMMARADCMTPQMLDALAGAGMYSIKYGVESCALHLLNACNKGTRWKQLKQALYATKQLGIKMHLTFTLGIPGETADTIRQTIDFATEIAPETAQFSICTPFPGTAFYAECKRNGWLITDDWEHFLGSEEAIVQTPWLSAAALLSGYHAACETWQKFQSERLRSRQEKLVQNLRKAVAGGKRWQLLGDPDFAGFIAKQAPELQAARLPDNPALTAPLEANTIAVIIDRHDEEKIFRQWLRRHGADAAKHVLRLFAG